MLAHRKHLGGEECSREEKKRKVDSVPNTGGTKKTNKEPISRCSAATKKKKFQRTLLEKRKKKDKNRGS